MTTTACPGQAPTAFFPQGLAGVNKDQESPTSEGLLEEGLVGTGEGEEAPLLDKDGLPHFKALYDMVLHESPHVDADKAGEIRKGTVFRGHKIMTFCADGKRVQWDHLPVGEICYIHLGEKMGWALSRNPLTNEALVESCDRAGAGTGASGCRQQLAAFFLSGPYDCLIATAVVLNVAAICWEIDRRGIQNLSQGTCLYVTAGFLVVYILDVLIKQVALGVTRYFSSSWNTLDFCATMVALVALLIGRDRTETRGVGAIFPAFRLLRLLRLACGSREFGQVAGSVAPRLLSLVWAAGLVALWLLVNSVVCMAFLGHEGMLPDEALPAAPLIRQRFATLPLSLASFLRVLTLRNWPDIVVPLAQRVPMVLFVLFCHVAVTTAVLIGMFFAVTLEDAFGSQKGETRARGFGKTRAFGTGRAAAHWPAGPKRSPPNSRKSGSSRPGAGKPGSARPGAARPSSALPSSARPGSARPSPAGPSSAKAMPGAPRSSPGLSKSPLGQSRPRLAAPTRPGSSRLALAGSGSTRLGRLTTAPPAGPAWPR